MLQRIQTVYMLASVVAISMMLFFPSSVISVLDAIDCNTIIANFELNGFGVSCVSPELAFDAMRYPLFGLLLVMILLPLVSIFLYNKRKLQMRVLIYNTILNALFYAYFFLFEVNACQGLAESAVGVSCISQMNYQFVVLAMPILSIFCCVMAIRGIAYDIALLASADRLRPSRKA